MEIMTVIEHYPLNYVDFKSSDILTIHGIYTGYECYSWASIGKIEAFW